MIDLHPLAHRRVAFLDQTPSGMAGEKRLACRKNSREIPENLFMRWLLLKLFQDKKTRTQRTKKPDISQL